METKVLAACTGPDYTGTRVVLDDGTLHIGQEHASGASIKITPKEKGTPGHTVHLVESVSLGMPCGHQRMFISIPAANEWYSVGMNLTLALRTATDWKIMSSRVAGIFTPFNSEHGKGFFNADQTRFFTADYFVSSTQHPSVFKLPAIVPKKSADGAVPRIIPPQTAFMTALSPYALRRSPNIVDGKQCVVIFSREKDTITPSEIFLRDDIHNTDVYLREVVREIADTKCAVVFSLEYTREQGIFVVTDVYELVAPRSRMWGV